jgi:hypothetical protein
MTDVLDVYDHEMDQLMQVQQRLTDRARHRRHNFLDFQREIEEAFAEVGFTVHVNWHKFAIDGQEQDGAMPEVTITGRTDPSHVFDKDRQVYEVTHDILGLGDEGVIKADPETVRNFMEGNGGGHDHGHGHSH